MAATPAKRANRGQNMSALLAEAAQKGDNFWASEDWALDDGEGESSDSSFAEEEVKPDVFDSDFNDTEESGDEDEDEDDVPRGRQRRDEDDRNAFTAARPQNKYKEVTTVKKKVAYKEPKKPSSGNDSGRNKKRKADDGFSVHLRSDALAEEAISSRVRKTTKQKTSEAEKIRKNKIVGNFRNRTTKNVKQTFQQRDLLVEALETEIQQMAEEEQSRIDRPVRDNERPMIRYHSRRGSYATITFANFDELPDLFHQEAPEPRDNSNKGKYFDRVSGRSYNTASEFRELRRKAGIPWINTSKPSKLAK